MTGPAVRLGLFFVAFFAVVGIQLPFWPVWLQSRGLDATDIGALMAISIGIKVVANPLAAHLADRCGERRRPILVLATAALGAFALFGLSHGFWPILAVSLLFFTLWPPIMPLGESLTMLAVDQGGLQYGRIRLWGSLSFIVLAVVSGRVLVDAPADAIYWMVLAAVAVAALACALLPDIRTESARSAGIPLIRLIRQPTFAVFLFAAAAVQGSHGVYYAFGTLHWQAAGYSDALIGALWAEGVIAEITLFIFGDRLVRWLGPAWLLALGGLAGMIRWTVTGLTDTISIVVVAQALHAFTFGASHLAAIHFVAGAVPPAISATAQSLYAAVVMGLGLGLALLASGWLYQTFAGGAYLAMAVLSGTGIALAWILARRFRRRREE